MSSLCGRGPKQPIKLLLKERVNLEFHRGNIFFRVMISQHPAESRIRGLTRGLARSLALKAGGEPYS